MVRILMAATSRTIRYFGQRLIFTGCFERTPPTPVQNFISQIKRRIFGGQSLEWCIFQGLLAFSKLILVHLILTDFMTTKITLVPSIGVWHVFQNKDYGDFRESGHFLSKFTLWKLGLSNDWEAARHNVGKHSCCENSWTWVESRMFSKSNF